MISTTITPTWKKQPLDVLNKMIEKRKKWFHETHKDAVAAIAINALKSIRANTNTFAGKETVRIGGNDIRLSERNDIHPSFYGASKKRCFRQGSGYARNAPRVDLGSRCVQLVPPSLKAWKDAKVWRVQLSNERAERWPKQPMTFHVVALTHDSVVSYLEKRFGRIAVRQGGLARYVLTLAMRKLSTKPPAIDKQGAHVSKVGGKYSYVASQDTGDEYSVHVESNLCYAVSAVKGGLAGIQNALKSAANKIAGLIRHRIGDALDKELSTPFPEVKKR